MAGCLFSKHCLSLWRTLLSFVSPFILLLYGLLSSWSRLSQAEKRVFIAGMSGVIWAAILAAFTYGAGLRTCACSSAAGRNLDRGSSTVLGHSGACRCRTGVSGGIANLLPHVSPPGGIAMRQTLAPAAGDMQALGERRNPQGGTWSAPPLYLRWKGYAVSYSRWRLAFHRFFMLYLRRRRLWQATLYIAEARYTTPCILLWRWRCTICGRWGTHALPPARCADNGVAWCAAVAPYISASVWNAASACASVSAFYSLLLLLCRIIRGRRVAWLRRRYRNILPCRYSLRESSPRPYGGGGSEKKKKKTRAICMTGISSTSSISLYGRRRSTFVRFDHGWKVLHAALRFATTRHRQEVRSIAELFSTPTVAFHIASNLLFATRGCQAYHHMLLNDGYLMMSMCHVVPVTFTCAARCCLYSLHSRPPLGESAVLRESWLRAATLALLLLS